MRLGILALAAIASLVSPALGQETPAPDDSANAPAEAAASPSGPGIRLELNKLEPAEGACHVYFVVDNQTGDEVGELQTDVYLFDREETVLRGLVLQFTGIRPQRTKVVPFELADLGCDAIGRVLLNDVVVCNRPDASPLQGCAELLAVTSLLAVGFTY